MNIDWFQPYEHTTHSEGVIFVTIFNLPRTSDINKKIGDIPGSMEPKNDIISIFEPFFIDVQNF